MNFTKVDFEKDVIQSEIPVLVDFSATWCGPCRAIAPFVEQVASEFSGKARVVTIDVDEYPEVAGKYGIMSIPSLVVFKGGQAVDRIVGAAPKDQISGLLARHL
ncbi:MAG TPA: thioredoxin [Fimbriimonadaceae bacterium]|nr:thioredoxin [Fimbriimonadaceae bacterium]